MEPQVRKKGVVMKKTIGSLIVLLLLATLCYAQVSRQVTTTGGDYNSKTNFTNLSVGGLDVTGNPGYIEMQGHDLNDALVLFYLWVDDTGDLCVTSNATATSYASFPTGDWTATGFDPVCTKVGSQS